MLRKHFIIYITVILLVSVFVSDCQHLLSVFVSDCLHLLSVFVSDCLHLLSVFVSDCQHLLSVFVSDCQHLLLQRTQLTEHYTFSCHLLHVSAVFGHLLWIVFALTINTAQCSTAQYSTVQYSTVRYSTAQCSTVQYSTAQHIAIQYSAVQYRDCTISKCFSGRYIWGWYCSLTSGFIKQVPASYLAHPFYLFFLHFIIQIPVCQNWAMSYQLLMELGRYCSLGSEHRSRCN